MSKENKGIVHTAFAWYFKSSLLLRILAGLILGAIAGIVFGPRIEWVAPFGDLFVRMLKMIVMPVIFFSLATGAASISPSRLGKVGIKILLFYMFTSAIAVAIGLVLGNLFHPGLGLALGHGAAAGKELTHPSIVDTILGIVPTNPFQSLAKGDVLPAIFFALVFGIGIAVLRDSSDERLRDAATTMYRFFDGAAEVMYLIVQWMLQYAPIGVFALLAVVFAQQGANAIGPLGTVVIAVYLGLILHFFLALGGFLTLFGISFTKFTSRVKEAMITAFVTRSSSGTLPVSLKEAEENMGVPRGICSFTLPLGATINMNGTAIYQGVCVLFVAFAIGHPLTLAQQVMVILTAVLASIGTAGVPGAGVIMLLLVLNSVGLSVDPGSPVAMAYAMILGIDALLDMGRTWLNVTGDLVGTAIVAKTEGELDPAKW